MAIFKISPDSNISEMVDCKRIDKQGKMWQVLERHVIDPVTATMHLVWEFITGFLFTDDGYSLKTEDDYVLKCEDQ